MSKNKLLPDFALIKAVMGYVTLIALILIIFPIKGKPLAVYMANSLPPLCLFACGESFFYVIEWLITRLHTSPTSSRRMT